MESDWDGGTRRYLLTPLGRRVFAARRREWEAFSRGLDDVLQAADSGLAALPRTPYTRYDGAEAPCRAPPGSRDHPANLRGHRTSPGLSSRFAE
jgi:hypothetical protein